MTLTFFRPYNGFMLTKIDLKQIKTVIKSEIKTGLKPVDKRLSGFDKKLDRLEKGIKKNYDNINMVIGFFDRDYLDLRARVERIENFLKIPPLST